jgi:hypothetical protein
MMQREEVLELNPLFAAHPDAWVYVEWAGVPTGSTIFDHNISYYGSSNHVPDAGVFRKSHQLPAEMYFGVMSDPSRVSWQIFDAILEARSATEVQSTPATLRISPDVPSSNPQEEFRWSTAYISSEKTVLQAKMIEYARGLHPLRVTVLDHDEQDVTCLDNV